jgi:hypothetical protein
MTNPDIVESLGNRDLLNLHKTAFLCSRQVPASIVLKCFDWAIAMRDAEKCVISGFHSRIEKDVLSYLLKGSQPVIVALARGIKTRLDPELKKNLDTGRLLIITPFKKNVTRVTEQTAGIRNELMLSLADEIVIGYAKPGGNVDRAIAAYQKTNKPETKSVSR